MASGRPFSSTQSKYGNRPNYARLLQTTFIVWKKKIGVTSDNIRMNTFKMS